MRQEYCMHYLIRLTDNTIVAVIMLSCPQFNKEEILLDLKKKKFFFLGGGGFCCCFFWGGVGGVGGGGVMVLFHIVLVVFFFPSFFLIKLFHNYLLQLRPPSLQKLLEADG